MQEINDTQMKRQVEIKGVARQLWKRRWVTLEERRRVMRMETEKQGDGFE